MAHSIQKNLLVTVVPLRNGKVMDWIPPEWMPGRQALLGVDITPTRYRKNGAASGI